VGFDRQSRLLKADKYLVSQLYEIAGRGGFMRRVRVFMSLVLFAFTASLLTEVCYSQSQSAKKSPVHPKLAPWSELRPVVEKHFAQQKGRVASDVLVASEAKASLDELDRNGWKPKESAKLLARVCQDSDFLVSELRTTEGRKFLSATSGEAHVYDRLDRLTKHSGGQKLVSSVIRLPNGPSFMRPKPTPGFGTLMDLLPKGASGKTPVDPQFNKPTGKIYTVAQWVKELETAHTAESKVVAGSTAGNKLTEK
jgi:hypothetical protein